MGDAPPCQESWHESSEPLTPGPALPPASRGPLVVPSHCIPRAPASQGSGKASRVPELGRGEPLDQAPACGGSTTLQHLSYGRTPFEIEEGAWGLGQGCAPAKLSCSPSLCPGREDQCGKSLQAHGPALNPCSARYRLCDLWEAPSLSEPPVTCEITETRTLKPGVKQLECSSLEIGSTTVVRPDTGTSLGREKVGSSHDNPGEPW